jgi:hypothetical protein
VASGTLADARLSSNVALLNATNIWTGVSNTFNNDLTVDGTVALGNGSGDDITLDPSGGGSLTVTGFTAGVVKSTGAGLLSTGTVDLASASDVSGILPIANGGTNSAAAPTSGGVAYGNGTQYQFTPAGTSGQILVSNGAGAPSWSSSVPSGTTIGFNQLTGGTNTTAAMLIGTGASLAPTGVGTITANQVVGTGSTTNAVDLATAEVAGTLPIANGGTNSTASPTNNGVAYGDGTSYQFTGAPTAYVAGTSPGGQLLRSTPGAGGGLPTWGPGMFYGNVALTAGGGAVVAVTDANVTAPSIIIVTYKDLAGAGIRSAYVTAQTAGTGFTVTLSAGPPLGSTPSIDYIIINP